MTRSYFCNGYLMLNNQKMAKSTGNFMSLQQCLKQFGVDASRVTMADAGDLLDDANFDIKVANASILKLFILEEWIQKHCPKSFDWNAVAESKNSEDKFGWDRIIDSEIDRIVKIVNESYAGMKFKNVVKYGFSELKDLKEAYLIAMQG